MKRKAINKRRYVTAFALTTLIFIIGILLGSFFSSLKIDNVLNAQTDLRLEIMGSELKYELLEDELCVVNISNLNLKLYETGNKLVFLESQLGPENQLVKELKEYYHLLEIRQVLLLRDAEKKCNATQNHILYFYTIDELCPSCKDQGEILTYIHKQNPVFNVYSFDANIENPAIRQLRNLYDIGQVPALVVNGKPYQGFHSRDQLLSVLESDGVI